MKIKVRTIERKFTIYIPNFLLTSGVKIANFVSKSLVENNVSKDGMDKVNEYMNALDMDFILVAMKELKKYKGLEIVNVKANDGTEVLIKM